MRVRKGESVLFYVCFVYGKSLFYSLLLIFNIFQNDALLSAGLGAMVVVNEANS